MFSARLRRASFFVRVVSSSIVGGVTWLGGASFACAESEVQPLAEAPGMVRVRLDAGQHPFRVFFGRGTRPIAACGAACEFWAWPGSYRVQVSDGEAPHVDSQLDLRVHEAGSFAFVPANGRAQNAGLILGVSGPVVGVVGLLLSGVSLLSRCHEGPGESCARPTSFYLGLGAAGLGAGMTTAGWLMYAGNRAQFRELALAPTPLRPRLAVSVLPQPAFGLAATLAF